MVAYEPRGHYFALSINKVFSTICLTNAILIDVDKDGKIVGIETIGKEFNEEVMMEIIRSFVYPEAIHTPNWQTIGFRV